MRFKFPYFDANWIDVRDMMIITTEQNMNNECITDRESCSYRIINPVCDADWLV